MEDYHRLRTLLAPSVSLEILDNFAKWLFTLTGVVAALGAGLGVTGANHLSISLALAALARLPLPVRVGPYSRVALQRGLSYVKWTRFLLLLAAALLFAAGLALAGWAQYAE
jgi:hypothetical protein